MTMRENVPYHDASREGPGAYENRTVERDIVRERTSPSSGFLLFTVGALVIVVAVIAYVVSSGSNTTSPRDTGVGVQAPNAIQEPAQPNTRPANPDGAVNPSNVPDQGGANITPAPNPEPNGGSTQPAN